ncbi:MAG: ABC transporter permease [Tissierellia bacterium]|nr:ABC transporter permease [Tissierellia bacterium]
MTVYKYFMKVALKHKFIILGYSTLFLLVAIINGTIAGTEELQFVETDLNIGIIDNMDSELSRGLVGYLEENNNIEDIIEDEGYIREQIFLQALDGAIIIPRDFDEKVINKEEAIELYKDDRRIGAYYLEQQVEKYLIFANATYEDNTFDMDSLKSALNKKANIELIETKKGLKNSRMDIWFKNYYNYTSYIIIAVYIAVIGMVMIEFRDKRLEDRMRISSKKNFSLNREIYLGQVSLGIGITSIFILGSLVLKGRYIGEVEFSKYMINIAVFSFAILCFTFLINNLTRSRFTINGISTVVSLGTSFISGVLVPQEFLGERALSIAKFFPTYYFVSINERSIGSFGDIRYELLMQMMFGIVFLLMGLYFARPRLRA